MDDLEAIKIIGEDKSCTKEQEIAAWQHLIDTGLVWQLQGFYQRGARDLIAQGLCRAAEKKDD